MRLIDADKIGLTGVELLLCNGSYKDALVMLIDKISNAPTVDAVPVVRCKDCKYAHLTYGGECKYCDIWFDEDAIYLDGDCFCSSAERKEE